MKTGRLLRNLFRPAVIGGAVAVGLILFIFTIALFWFIRPGSTPASPATAVLDVIRAPALTTPVPVSSPTPSATAEGNIPPPPPAGAIQSGSYVQVQGTGGDGLRLRLQPGLKSEVWMLGGEAEVFRVDDGPRELDGFTWWYLVGPYDATRRGWAVSNYLAPVQKP